MSRGALVLALALTVVAASPPDPASVPVEQRGLAVGARIPQFEAVDQFGRSRTFPSLAGPDGLVLLFVRSADW